MCGVCQQAPAAVTCKADAAAFCVSCDSDIHSANPLARRHERVPVEPFYDAAESIVVKSTTGPSSAAVALNYLVPVSRIVLLNLDMISWPWRQRTGKIGNLVRWSWWRFRRFDV
ncbi:hypothetical protein ACFX12_000303 [Malus domestica]